MNDDCAQYNTRCCFPEILGPSVVLAKGGGGICLGLSKRGGVACAHAFMSVVRTTLCRAFSLPEDAHTHWPLGQATSPTSHSRTRTLAEQSAICGCPFRACQTPGFVPHGPVRVTPATRRAPPRMLPPQFREGGAQTDAGNGALDPDPGRDFHQKTEQAFECLAKGADVQACSLFKQALVLRPTDVQALYNVASAEMQLGNTEVARGYLRMAADNISETSSADGGAAPETRRRRRRKEAPLPAVPPPRCCGTDLLEQDESIATWKERFACPWLQPDGRYDASEVDPGAVFQVINLRTGAPAAPDPAPPRPASARARHRGPVAGGLRNPKCLETPSLCTGAAPSPDPQACPASVRCRGVVAGGLRAASPKCDTPPPLALDFTSAPAPPDSCRARGAVRGRFRGSVAAAIQRAAAAAPTAADLGVGPGGGRSRPAAQPEKGQRRGYRAAAPAVRARPVVAAEVHLLPQGRAPSPSLPAGAVTPQSRKVRRGLSLAGPCRPTLGGVPLQVMPRRPC